MTDNPWYFEQDTDWFDDDQKATAKITSLVNDIAELRRQNKELLEAAEGVMEWWLNDDRESIGQTERRFELLRIAIAEAKEK